MIVSMIVVAIVIYLLTSSTDKREPTSQPNVSTNVIVYPDVVCSECKQRVKPNMKTIDISTWDLKCDCGHIAYKHPKREERKEQLDNMLDW